MSKFSGPPYDAHLRGDVVNKIAEEVSLVVAKWFTSNEASIMELALGLAQAIHVLYANQKDNTPAWEETTGEYNPTTGRFDKRGY